jgi:plastocyanin
MKAAPILLRWLVLMLPPLGALLAALVLAMGPGRAASAISPQTWHEIVGVQSSDHAIQGMVFLPGDLWIDAGDTVIWTTRSGEPHTVSFLPPGQRPAPLADPSDSASLLEQGGTHYDGRSRYSSGTMATSLYPDGGALTYQLTFDRVGDFTYYCLVHPMMRARIHVRPAGTPYPYSQAQYDQQARRQTATILHQGQELTQWATQHAGAHQVIVGIGAHPVSVMRFFPQRVVVHVGDTITFTDHDRMLQEPHDVEWSAADQLTPLGDAQHFDGILPLHSGWLGYQKFDVAHSFKVTFTAPGIDEFSCDWHDYLGMKVTVVVRR